MSRPSRIFAYCRVSSVAQADGSSLRDQEAACRTYAKAAHRTTVTRMFVEAESSVRENIEARVQMQTLLRDVREGDLVVCDKIDRWSRDPEFTYRSVREILGARASMYFVSDQCDPSTPEGDTTLNFRVLFAREEHKRIKQRMVGTRNLLRDRGFYVEGTVAWGYRRSVPKGAEREAKNVLVVEESEAAQVRRAFQLCIQGRSMREIADALGVKLDRVKDALSRRFYIGEMQSTSREWMKGKHPPIIDADTFARAHAAIDGRRHGPRPGEATAATSGSILRDVARCALCGGAMSASYGQTRGYLRCYRKCTSRYVPVLAIEAEAEPLILARLEALRLALAQKPKQMKQPPVSNVEERRARLRRRRERYLEAFADEAMTRDELRAAMAKLDAERLRLDAEEQAAQKVSPLAAPDVQRRMLLNVNTLHRAWGRASPEERRVIVGELAHEARLAVGEPLAFRWRSAVEMAQDVD